MQHGILISVLDVTVLAFAIKSASRLWSRPNGVVFGVKVLTAKNETTIGISDQRSCRWLYDPSVFLLAFGGGSSVSFPRWQSDFPYTIFTPFRRGVV